MIITGGGTMKCCILDNQLHGHTLWKSISGPQSEGHEQVSKCLAKLCGFI